MKRIILNTVVALKEQELDRLQRANAQSNQGAAFSAPHAEKQRDSSGIEAAYLARGYAAQHKALVLQIDELKAIEAEDFTGQEIDVGALVEVEMDGETDCYLLLNCGGGAEVVVEGRPITVITPESPLGRALVGNIEAGSFTLRSGLEGIILSVC